MTTPRSALIVGLGIAGMSAALRLHEAGWAPVIVERAPERRTGGYMVGMFPEGIAAAERLGVNDDIVKRGGPEMLSFHVDSDGTRRPGPGFGSQPGAPATVLRSDIEAGLWSAIEGRVEVRFGTTPVSIDQTTDKAIVTLDADGVTTVEHFDLVVGADGLRSTVRGLAFGAHEQYLKPMDAMICAFQLSDELPGLPGLDSVIAADPKRAMWVFGLKDTNPTVLFTWRTKKAGKQRQQDRSTVIRDVFDSMPAGGLVPAAIDQLDAAPVALYDTVEQVRMPSWHTGRVVLVGDAAWCLTLYSGMGATAGMLGGATLGDKIAEHPTDISTALEAYETDMRPFITKQQRTARLKSELFVPSSRAAWWLRRQLLGSKLGQRAALPPGAKTPAAA